jgi:hypothetical protein
MTFLEHQAAHVAIHEEVHAFRILPHGLAGYFRSGTGGSICNRSHHVSVAFNGSLLLNICIHMYVYVFEIQIRQTKVG